MKIISFTLSMPGRSSHNGKWSGEDKPYVVVKSLPNKTAEKIVDQEGDGYYGYSFGDGWRAGVDVKVIDSKIARVLRKKSAGFCGYNWMIDSIIFNQEIKPRER